MKRFFTLLIVLALVLTAFLAGRSYQVDKVIALNKRTILYYFDPMHPSYKSDKPGIAPDCGMELVPQYSDGGADSSTHDSAMPGRVAIDLEQQQLIGIKLASASQTAGMSQLEIPGRVVVDDTRTYRLAASLGGVVSTTFDHSVGSLVKKDEILAIFDSPDLIAAEQAFLQNKHRAPENKYQWSSVSEWKDQFLRLAADRLRSLGMSEAQFQELVRTEQPVQALKIVAPVSGIILSRNLSVGQQVERGAEFYRISDLNRVWVLASFPGREVEGIRPGSEATISLSDGQRHWRARVSDALPQFDPATRSMQVRLEVENPGLMLRPEMFVNVEIPVHSPEALTVPEEALLDSGLSKRVYVALGGNSFEPREVSTGRRSAGRIEILDGLVAGDKVVTSGTFLLDSESRLKAPRRAEPANKVAAVKLVASKPVATETDPVCGMSVDAAKATAEGNSETVHGKKLYFCSRQCHDKFRSNPAKYISEDNSKAGKKPAAMGQGSS